MAKFKPRYPYQNLFEAFGSRAAGQIAAAVAIGILFGVRGALHAGWSWNEAGLGAGIGGGIGLVGGILLAAVDVRRRKVAAGLLKPYGCAEWLVIVIIGGGIALFLMLWFVMR